MLIEAYMTAEQVISSQNECDCNPCCLGFNFRIFIVKISSSSWQILAVGDLFSGFVVVPGELLEYLE